MPNKLVELQTDGDIALVRLNRPEKHNGMSMAMLEDLLDVASGLKHDTALRGIVLCGNGPSFCAGLDFKSVLGKPASMAGLVAQLWLPYANKFQRWSLSWREIGVPVIAALHGNCFGAGLQLALGADIRIATADAKLSIMESKWGLIPDMGAAVLLRELLRIDVAKELTFSGRIVSGSQAQALGLVTHVADDPLARARELIDEFRSRSPDAVAAAKFLLQETWAADESDATAAERRRQRRIIGRGNQRIAIERNQKNPERPYLPRSVKR